MLRLQRPQFCDGENTSRRILELFGAVEKKRKFIETFRSDIYYVDERERVKSSTRRTFLVLLGLSDG